MTMWVLIGHTPTHAAAIIICAPPVIALRDRPAARGEDCEMLYKKTDDARCTALRTGLWARFVFVVPRLAARSDQATVQCT